MADPITSFLLLLAYAAEILSLSLMAHNAVTMLSWASKGREFLLHKPKGKKMMLLDQPFKSWQQITKRKNNLQNKRKSKIPNKNRRTIMAMAGMNLAKRRQENHLHLIMLGKGVEVETEDQAVGQTTTIHIHWETTMITISIGNHQKQRNCLDSLI